MSTTGTTAMGATIGGSPVELAVTALSARTDSETGEATAETAEARLRGDTGFTTGASTTEFDAVGS